MKYLIFLFPVLLQAVTVNDNLEVTLDDGQKAGFFADAVINWKSHKSDIEAAVKAKLLSKNAENPVVASGMVKVVEKHGLSIATDTKDKIQDAIIDINIEKKRISDDKEAREKARLKLTE